MQQEHLVIGLGQIGSAIKTILSADGLDSREPDQPPQSTYPVLHICFPYSASFADEVGRYRTQFSPELVIIHSTVPVGTSAQLGAEHSPCRGKHPDLEEGIRVFAKFFGGKGAERAAKYFSNEGITTKTTPSSESTEAMKLWDTTIYGWNILLEKAIHSFCIKHTLDFDIVYTEANRSYNEGYEKLGHPEYAKYILRHVEGKIGGHCVIPNLEMLDSEIAQIIQKFNASI